VFASSRTRKQANRKDDARTDRSLHPVLAKIELFIASRFRRMNRLLRKRPLSPEHLTEILKLATEVNAFMGCVDQPFYALTEREKHRRTDRVFEFGQKNRMSNTQIVDILKGAAKRPRGHQVETRHLALAALESKLTHPHRTWDKILEKLCPSRGRELLRRDIVRLRNLLRRHGLLSRYC
jgi:hypothetical protein